MSNLSSTTLFHFTSSLDVIRKILLGGIKYGMFAEKLPKGNLAYFVRGISFCNIPLSMISEHVEWYGKYALGIKRPALRSLGVSPVFYVHSDTKMYPSGKTAENDLLGNPFLCYLKQHLGYQYHKTKKKYQRKSFYDEKEWRIFAGNPTIDHYTSLINLESLRQKKDLVTPTVPPLHVTLDMIEYIILDSSSDFDAFDSFLKTSFPAERDSFLTKIMYYSQIRKDF